MGRGRLPARAVPAGAQRLGKVTLTQNLPLRQDLGLGKVTLTQNLPLGGDLNTQSTTGVLIPSLPYFEFFSFFPLFGGFRSHVF